MVPAKEKELPAGNDAAEAGDFDDSSDLCDFGYVLVRESKPGIGDNAPDLPR